MDKEVRERFERIELNLERVTERLDVVTQRLDRISEAHLELETAQINSQKAHDRLAAIVEDVGEKLANLTILVDRLIERDLGRT